MLGIRVQEQSKWPRPSESSGGDWGEGIVVSGFSEKADFMERGSCAVVWSWSLGIWGKQGGRESLCQKGNRFL